MRMWVGSVTALNRNRGTSIVAICGRAKNLLPQVQRHRSENRGIQRHRIGQGPGGRIIAAMKDQTSPLWLLRDIPALLGVMLSF